MAEWYDAWFMNEAVADDSHRLLGWFWTFGKFDGLIPGKLQNCRSSSHPYLCTDKIRSTFLRMSVVL